MKPVDATKMAARTQRPGHRRAVDTQHRFHLVQQFHRITSLAIHLINKRHDRGIAQPADIHQLDRAFLDTLGRIDHHQRRIYRGQRPIGVFGEIRVAGCIQQIDDKVAIFKLHHRGRYRNAAFLLEFHPVRRRVATTLTSANSPGFLNGATVMQEFFRQRGLARIGM